MAANIINKKERIEAIERALWLMEFKDHWDNKDWAERAELNAELAELNAELAELKRAG